MKKSRSRHTSYLLDWSKFSPALVILMVFVMSLYVYETNAQDDISFEHVADFEFPSQGFYTPSSFSSQIDNVGREYIYTANKHAGVITFNIDDIMDPVPIDTMTVTDFQNLRPTSVVQQNNLLFVALGEFEGLTQRAGLAIVNIMDPDHPEIVSQWDSLAFDKGCPFTIVSGEYAYLAAMEHGVIILDISNTESIKFKSHVSLDRQFPKEPTITSEPHARGLALYGDRLLVAHDAGGLRVVNIANKSIPVEETKYVNDSMFNTTQVAYNKVEVFNDRAYISTDYCGMEVLDLSRLPALHQGQWYNPFDCKPETWIGGEGHTNGIKILDNEELLFMSAGDTEVLAYDIKDPNHTIEIGRYQMLDSTVAWSLDVRDDLIVLSCIDNHLFPLQPYYADFGGIMLLRWKRTTVTISDQNVSHVERVISPNPAQDKISLTVEKEPRSAAEIMIYDVYGRQVMFRKINDFFSSEAFDISTLSNGIYFLVMTNKNGLSKSLFIKQQ